MFDLRSGGEFLFHLDELKIFKALFVVREESGNSLLGLQSVTVLVKGKHMELTKIIRAEGGPKQWSTL